MPTPQNPVQELLALYAQQRFADMERTARALVKQGASAPILDELLGMALAAQGRFADALPFLTKAADAVPTDAQFFNNLGNCQRELGQFEAAEKSLRKSLQIQPNATETMTTLASVFRAQNKRTEARELFERALAAIPNHVFARFNLGGMLKEEGQAAAAEEQFRFAIAANPNIAVIHEELATVLVALGRLPDAEAELRKACALDPAGPRAFALLASLLAKMLRKMEAVQTADAALQRVGQPTRDTIAKNITLFDIIAEAYSVGGDYDSASKIFKELCTLAPSLGRSVAAYTSLRWTCDWETTAKIEMDLLQAVRGQDLVGIGANIMVMMPSATADDQLLAMKKTAAMFDSAVRVAPAVIDRRSKKSDNRRIRIGYMSSDFRDHVVSHAVAGVIEAHDKAAFEVVACDSSPPTQDIYRKRLEAAFERWLPLTALSDNDAAQCIADAEIDILVDLMGWTQGYRAAVLAQRPVPLQIYWLGIAGTTGAPWIDYQIADRVVIPPGHESHYSEKIIRLPNSFFPTDLNKPVKQALSRKEYGLPEDGIVFCSFNMSFKFTPELFDVWLRLLRDVSGSVLWIKEPVARAEEVLKAHAIRSGVDPGRIVFARQTKALADHLARVSLADIALDCFPYGSHTTSTDMVLMGVPLVALRGETLPSRVSASVLSAANLSDLVTSSYDEYYALALKLATDRFALEQMKARVRASRTESTFFDTRRFTRDLENAYRLVWERHLAGQSPANIDIPSDGAH